MPGANRHGSYRLDAQAEMRFENSSREIAIASAHL